MFYRQNLVRLIVFPLLLFFSFFFFFFFLFLSHRFYSTKKFVIGLDLRLHVFKRVVHHYTPKLKMLPGFTHYMQTFKCSIYHFQYLYRLQTDHAIFACVNQLVLESLNVNIGKLTGHYNPVTTNTGKYQIRRLQLNSVIL